VAAAFVVACPGIAAVAGVEADLVSVIVTGPSPGDCDGITCVVVEPSTITGAGRAALDVDAATVATRTAPRTPRAIDFIGDLL
jgi:hypothetical protein